MARFAVILPAAGRSSRMSGFRHKKPFLDLKGRAVWLRSVEHFINREDVCETVIVIGRDDMTEFRERFRANLAFLNLNVVEGGASRAESVRHGLTSLTSDADYVAVHDAARPLLTSRWIDAVFAAAVTHRAAIPGLRISSTVKRISARNTIEATVERDHLVMAQTPQVFERTLLQKAFAACRDLSSVTDEASLVEQLGEPVQVVDGWPMNIKITTADDFRAAERLLDALPRNDGLKSLHPFADERFI